MFLAFYGQDPQLNMTTHFNVGVKRKSKLKSLEDIKTTLKTPKRRFLFLPVDKSDSRMVTDGALLNIAEAGNGSFLAQDPLHLRVVLVLGQVGQVDVPRLEGHQLAIELDMLKMFIKEETIAHTDLA